MPRTRSLNGTDHHIEKRYFCHPSTLVLVDLHDLLCICADGNEHPPGTGKLLDERRGERGCGRPDMDRVERPFFRNTCSTSVQPSSIAHECCGITHPSCRPLRPS